MPVFNAFSNAIAQYMMGGDWVYWVNEGFRLMGFPV